MIRRGLCWLGLMAIALLFISAELSDYEPRIVEGGGQWIEVEDVDGRKAGIVYVEDLDHSGEPWNVKLFRKYGLITVIVGVVLLWGALKKNRRS